MNALELARWQFAVVTIYHFIFVPVSIGLSLMVASMQTRWYRTGAERYLRMTKFWGKLLLINFSVGVVTGIVQEFQFGMNWSEYSRYVGDIFGAPLAMEGLIAFFLESTFLGLWLFGWGRLSKGLHLASIWLFAAGTVLSAYFILAANSFMQHPVGLTVNEQTGRAEMDSIVSVLTNSTVLLAFPHTVFFALSTAAAVVIGVSAWHLMRRNEVEVFTSSARFGVVFLLIGTLAGGLAGHAQGQLMTEQQPMKMAAAEALYNTKEGAGLSLFAVAPFEHHPERLSFNIQIPHLLSFLSTNTLNGKVEGLNQIQARYEQQYGPGDYMPTVGLTYWAFRIMAGAGVAMLALGAWFAWLWRKGRLAENRWFTRAALAGMVLPFAANATGWVFTEVGRQPWVVQGLLRTDNAASPAVSAGEVATSFAVLGVLYGILAVIAVWLFVKYARKGPDPVGPDAESGSTDRPDLSMAY
ncbi:MAG: cytochrome ubiquinol oxidase subunit I [Thermoleophilia bacterium]|nr:cytochrome ubiquinol oxidase subunit I [Thermoleophilia bacterium]